MNGEDKINEQVKSAVETAKAKKAAEGNGKNKSSNRKPSRAFPFKVDANGVHRRKEYEKSDGSTGTKWVRLGSELHVVAFVRNEDGEGWGRWLEIVDREGKRHLWHMPYAMLMGTGETLRTELAEYGFELATGREPRVWLLEYLATAEPTQKVRSATRVGWHGKTFVFPDEAIGPDREAERVILRGGEHQDHAFNVSGSLQQWQSKVAAKAMGNSRLILSICVSIAAPTLAITGEETGGFHIRGASSSGKSTALDVAGSFWGGGGLRGYKGQWRTTDNALESTAALRCDALLAMDEISQIDPKAAIAAIYMLGNGKGKARAGREGQARKVPEWRLLFLSNGEIGLADKVKEIGGRASGGTAVRVIDLRADAGADMGLFENIHGAKDPATFAQDFKAAISKYYGTAAREWVRILAKDSDNIRDDLARLCRLFKKNEVPEGADGQVDRVADRFALCAAAGELATANGITGWSQGEATKSAQRCFKDWLHERGGIGSSEVADARQRIAEALQVGGSANFQRWKWSSSDRIQVPNRQGFIRLEGNPDVEEVETTYYFLPEPLKTLLGGLDFRSVMTGLMENGIIVGYNDKPYKTYRVPTLGGTQKLYEINTEALNATEGGIDA